ncbi:IS5 family transposase [Reyranella sp.]|uniref:IS5 family transposase n=1 Tax=Reyranella sp. TaxID=1929291 RepID=UPI0025DBDCCC|nr:IS5 family transposase [Reyranella sp.]
MFRGDLTDEEWAIIGGLLPPERGRWARPAGDNRLFLNGMLNVLRTGCPWRDMHERYGKWNSVYVRFRRWAEQGVWDALLQTLVDIGLTDDWQHMIDSTIVRGHAQAAGAKGGLVRKLLVDHAAVLRARSTPVVTIKDALLALSSPAEKHQITKP